jgi:hypothetical protein
MLAVLQQISKLKWVGSRVFINMFTNINKKQHPTPPLGPQPGSDIETGYRGRAID